MDKFQKMLLQRFTKWRRSPGGKRVVYLIVALLPFIVTIGAIISYSPLMNTPSPKVVFFLPEDFNGSFAVVCPLKQRWWNFFVDPPREFHIPADGVLVIDDDRIFSRWHTVVVVSGGITFYEELGIDNTISTPWGDRVFLSKGSGSDGVIREHWNYWGSPHPKTDIDRLNKMDDVIRAKMAAWKKQAVK